MNPQQSAGPVGRQAGVSPHAWGDSADVPKGECTTVAATHAHAAYRKLSQNHSDGIAPTDLTCDELRAPKGFVAPSVDYQVVLNALMHAFSLLHRHAGVPVAASDLTARSDLGVTLHTNPEDLVSAQMARHTLLALATVKEDVIEHEVCSAFGHSAIRARP